MLPVIGTKEFIAWLPVMLGLGPGDVLVYPELAYPTYDIGARLAGADRGGLGQPAGPAAPARVRLVWLNSPSNPTGRVLPAEHLRKVVTWARERGAVVASDECYIDLGWEATPVSVLHPAVCGGSRDGRAGRALAVQAVQPGRLPGRVRHRRPGPGRGAAGHQEAGRDDRAGPGAGGDDRGVRRRGARSGAAGGV